MFECFVLLSGTKLSQVQKILMRQSRSWSRL